MRVCVWLCVRAPARACVREFVRECIYAYVCARVCALVKGRLLIYDATILCTRYFAIYRFTKVHITNT